jgi:sec-independent protein translocase protein TatA
MKQPIQRGRTVFERLPEIIVLCVVGLLVFGPKRVIEMGGTLGKAWRDFRESTKDLSWTALLSGDEQPSAQHYSSVPAAPATPAATVASAAPSETPALNGTALAPAAVVEGSVEPQPQAEGERD